jgi:hypothetical protein
MRADPIGDADGSLELSERSRVWLRIILDGMLHRRHASRGTRAASRGSARLQRVTGDLSADLPRIVRNPRYPDAGRQLCSSGDFRRHYCHHCFCCSVRTCSCYPWRLRRRGLWSFGARALGTRRIPLLGERPNDRDWVGIVLISAGVYLASGGPLAVLEPARGPCLACGRRAMPRSSPYAANGERRSPEARSMPNG